MILLSTFFHHPAIRRPGDGARETARLWPVSFTTLLTGVLIGIYVSGSALASGPLLPNDPDFPKQWGLNNIGQGGGDYGYDPGTPDADIDAPEAWAITTGSSDVVVGVIDTGVTASDPELAPNMWTNPGGINDCPAGTHGYDFYRDNCYPSDTQGHGTKVASVLGAAGNNGAKGTGVSWTTKIIDLRPIPEFLVIGNFYTDTGPTIANTIAAVDWAIKAKKAGVNVRILNCSCPDFGYSQAFRDKIREAGDNGILFVAASDNHNRDVDKQPAYPCAYDAPNLICVGGTDNNDKPIYNWGAKKVHIAAPAINLVPHCGSGTSCAAPLVSGAAALILSQYPNLSAAEVKSKILNNVDRLASLEGKNATSGRLNLYKALTGPIAPPPPPAPPSPSGTTGNGGSSGGATSSAGSSAPSKPGQTAGSSSSTLTNNAVGGLLPAIPSTPGIKGSSANSNNLQRGETGEGEPSSQNVLTSQSQTEDSSGPSGKTLWIVLGVIGLALVLSLTRERKTNP